LRVVMKVMIKPQGQIDHEGDFGDDLGAAAETGDEVTNVAVVLLDGDSQVFAGEELILRDEAVKPFPIVGQEDFVLDTDFIEELLTGGIITATKHPGDGAPTHRVIRSPNPELFSLFFRKCHISSSVRMTVSPVISGSGSLAASVRIQL
jgi:hypothetical protein